MVGPFFCLCLLFGPMLDFRGCEGVFGVLLSRGRRRSRKLKRGMERKGSRRRGSDKGVERASCESIVRVSTMSS
jgi:hypothetical protein